MRVAFTLHKGLGRREKGYLFSCTSTKCKHVRFFYSFKIK